jgi:hypothetical protein
MLNQKVPVDKGRENHDLVLLLFDRKKTIKLACNFLVFTNK